MNPALEIRALRKTYANGVDALRGIDLTLEEGGFLALLGPNGAGKSTLIGILTGLVTATAGEAEVFGISLGREPERARALMGVVPQEFNFNIFEKCREILIHQAGLYGIPRSQARPRAEALLKELDLEDKRDQIAMNLSGGMKRRLMVARALMNRPRLLILDEPTAGVDIELRRGLWEFLARLNREGTTVILTTHYLEEAEHLCRDLAIIDLGRILEQGPIKELLRQLDRQTFILDLGRRLEAPPTVEGYRPRLMDGAHLEVDLARGQSLNPLFSQLDALGIPVVGMRNKANRLEELFVSLVSRGRP